MYYCRKGGSQKTKGAQPERLFLFFLRLEGAGVFKQPHLQVGGSVDHTAVNQHFAISHAHNQATVNYTLHVEAVGHFFRCRQNLARQFDLANAQRAAFTFTAQPAQIEANQLP